MTRQTTVKNLPRTASMARVVETKKGELKENAEGERRRYDEGNQRHNPSAGHHRGGGRDEKSKTNTKWKGGTTHSPARGGSAQQKMHSKEETK